MINPTLFIVDKSSAIEVGEGDSIIANEVKEDGDSLIEEEGVAETEVADAVTENYGVMPLEVVAPTVTFEIGGQGQDEVVETAVDEVAYRSHTVNVSLNNVDEYFLYISGNTNLTAASGGVALTGTGTTGVAGSNIEAGQWGYGWDYTGRTANASMTYKTVPTTQTKLTVPELSNNAVSFNGKLNFAAKFPTNATLGNYTSNVNLTLIASPKAQTGSANWRNETGGETALAAGTETMQGIKSGFCKGNDNVKEGWAVDLIDNRDGKTYTVYKAADGNCWMGQNLALTGPLTLASGDSDLPSGTTWSMPASVGSGGTNTNDINTSNTWDVRNYNVIQIRTGDDSLANWKNGYGNYYSWRAATAGTGTTSIINTDAPASICPKSWRLPPYSGDNSYTNLIQAYSIENSSFLTGQTINGIPDMTGYRFGPITLYKGANFWLAADGIRTADASIISSSSRSFYWSRTSSDPDSAYYMYLIREPNIDINPRCHGFSIRCVATY